MDELIEMARLLEQMAGKLRRMEKRIAELERRQPAFPIPHPCPVPHPPTPRPWWENPVIARSDRTDG